MTSQLLLNEHHVLLEYDCQNQVFGGGGSLKLKEVNLLLRYTAMTTPTADKYSQASARVLVTTPNHPSYCHNQPASRVVSAAVKPLSQRIMTCR